MLLGSLCIPAGTVQRSVTSSNLETTPTGLNCTRPCSFSNFHMQEVQSDILFSPFFSFPPSSVSLRRTHTESTCVDLLPERFPSLLPFEPGLPPPSSLFHGCCLGWLVGGWDPSFTDEGKTFSEERGRRSIIHVEYHAITSPLPLLFHIPKVWFSDLSIVLREALHHRHTRFFKNKKTVEFPPGSRSLPTDLYSCGGQRASGAPLACQSKAPVKQPSSRIKLSVRPARGTAGVFREFPRTEPTDEVRAGKKSDCPDFADMKEAQEEKGDL